jgi:hypothetical protein
VDEKANGREQAKAGELPMNRTGAQRVEAIPAAVERSQEFQARVRNAEGDAVRCADLMAEAIAMDREARGLEAVGRDGRSTFAIERLMACHCLDAAREAYLRARGSNHP